METTRLKKGRGKENIEYLCKTEFKKFRNETGIACKNCGSNQHYWISTTEQYKCKYCGTKTSLRTGTVLERSKLPYYYWYAALRLVYSDVNKQKGSITRLQKKLGHKRYQSIWGIVNKLNKSKKNEQRKKNKITELIQTLEKKKAMIDFSKKKKLKVQGTFKNLKGKTEKTKNTKGKINKKKYSMLYVKLRAKQTRIVKFSTMGTAQEKEILALEGKLKKRNVVIANDFVHIPVYIPPTPDNLKKRLTA